MQVLGKWEHLLINLCFQLYRSFFHFIGRETESQRKLEGLPKRHSLLFTGSKMG